MGEVWGVLLPLGIASTLAPVQLIVTLTLLRSSFATAAAWVAGMATVRLSQGLLFDLVFTSAYDEAAAAYDGQDLIASTLLLVLSLLFYAAALRTATKQPDPDAPTSAWMEKATTLTPGRAYLAGVALMLVGVKWWVMTLGAVDAIVYAEMTATNAVAAFLAFAVLAQAGHFVILGLAASRAHASERALEAMSAWLERNGAGVKMGLGVVFGTWFLYKALSGFGVL